MSDDPLARYEKRIKRPLSDAERLAIGPAALQSQSVFANNRQLRKIAKKARRQEIGLKAKGK